MNPSTELRELVAGVARAAVPDDVAVFDALPDQIAVPAVLVGWGDPWLERSTVCDWSARIELIVVAGRLEPGAQTGRLEELAHLLLDACTAADLGPATLTAPFGARIAGVDYLLATITITTEV